MIEKQPFIELQAEEIEPPEPGHPVVVATPFSVFKATWLGKVDNKTWTLTDACRLMQELAEAEKERE